jgi:hypothetical protein
VVTIKRNEWARSVKYAQFYAWPAAIAREIIYNGVTKIVDLAQNVDELELR